MNKKYGNRSAVGRSSNQSDSRRRYLPPQDNVDKNRANSSEDDKAPINGNSAVFLVTLFIVLLCACCFCFPASAQLIDEDPEGRPSVRQTVDDGLTNIALSSLTGMYSLPKVHILPIDLSAGSKPIEEAYTLGARNSHNEIQDGHYKDDTIEVDVWTEPMGNTVAHYARVKISHPSQFRTAFSGQSYYYASKYRETPLKMAVDNNAVVAINSDFCCYSGNGSIIIKQGVFYQYTPMYYDVLLVDSDGNFHIVNDQTIELDTSGQYPVWNGNEIYNSFSFGPALVKDGVAITDYTNVTASVTSHYLVGKALVARAAIAQIGELEYLLCIVDGTRSQEYGVRLCVLAEALAEKGATQAYNLDGGHSATLIFHGEKASHPASKDDSGSQRTQSDIIYFASAIN